MKKISNFLLLFLLWPGFALAADYGLNDANNNGNNLPVGRGATFAEKLAAALGSVIGSFLAFLGVIFLVIMIAGGLIWMTAAGDEKKVGTAKSLLTGAVIGLVIVLSAYAITAYLGDSVLKPI